MIARACDIPKDGLLQACVGQGETYTDCFEVMSPLEIDLAEFIAAFYTTWLFRLERFVLTLPLRRFVRDADVDALAQGAKTFAVWQVEARDDTQILLSDSSGHTRSWLAVSPKQGGVTRLLFGSVVVAPTGKPLSGLVRFLIPAHVFYSKCLLRLAERKLRHS